MDYNDAERTCARLLHVEEAAKLGPSTRRPTTTPGAIC